MGGTNGTEGRYSVPQTARLLGISERAVRKRITTGTLSAELSPHGWLVDLPAVLEAVPGGTNGGTGAVPSEPARYQVPPVDTSPAATAGELDAVREAWHHAREEAAFLRDELRRVREEHAAEREQWHARLREALFALAQRPALPAPSAPAVPETSEQITCNPAPPPPWWKRWWRW